MSKAVQSVESLCDDDDKSRFLRCFRWFYEIIIGSEAFRSHGNNCHHRSRVGSQFVCYRFGFKLLKDFATHREPKCFEKPSIGCRVTFESLNSSNLSSYKTSSALASFLFIISSHFPIFRSHVEDFAFFSLFKKTFSIRIPLRFIFYFHDVISWNDFVHFSIESKVMEVPTTSINLSHSVHVWANRSNVEQLTASLTSNISICDWQTSKSTNLNFYKSVDQVQLKTLIIRNETKFYCNKS